VKEAIKLRSPQKLRNLLASWATISFFCFMKLVRFLPYVTSSGAYYVQQQCFTLFIIKKIYALLCYHSPWHGLLEFAVT
jgi:hypothetical protein